MRYYSVNVQDRVTGECVTVGSMLTLDECWDLIGLLENYNAIDLVIYNCDEEFKK